MCVHPGILQLLASGAWCPSVGGNTRLTGGSSGHTVFVYLCVVGVFKNLLGMDIDFLGLSVPIHLLPWAMGGLHLSGTLGQGAALLTASSISGVFFGRSPSQVGQATTWWAGGWQGGAGLPDRKLAH